MIYSPTLESSTDHTDNTDAFGCSTAPELRNSSPVEMDTAESSSGRTSAYSK